MQKQVLEGVGPAGQVGISGSPEVVVGVQGYDTIRYDTEIALINLQDLPV